MNSPGRQMPNMLLENSGKVTPERMKKQNQSKNNTQLCIWLVMEVKSDAVKNNIAQEPGKLVHESRQIGSGQRGDGKSEIDILGISELRWTGMGEFNSDDLYMYYCGQESLGRNGVVIIVNKSPKCNTWMQSQK